MTKSQQIVELILQARNAGKKQAKQLVARALEIANGDPMLVAYILNHGG
jgi:hypothetical protein